MNQTSLGKEDLLCYVNRSWSVAWPMILIMLFEFMIGLTDVFVSGRVGKEAQATYGYAIQLYFIFIVIANALRLGLGATAKPSTARLGTAQSGATETMRNAA